MRSFSNPFWSLFLSCILEVEKVKVDHTAAGGHSLEATRTLLSYRPFDANGQRIVQTGTRDSGTGLWTHSTSADITRPRRSRRVMAVMTKAFYMTFLMLYFPRGEISFSFTN